MKENYEWCKSWSDCAPKKDLPRVLLLGDSITDGYSLWVRDLLRGEYYVDSFATSYAVDTEIYQTLVKAFIEDNEYAVVHYNHGLHGKHMTKEIYQKGVEKCLQGIKCRKILALTTEALVEGNIALDESWAGKIAERNGVLYSLAKEYALQVDDLYMISKQMPLDLRGKDGVHFTTEGYQHLAKQVVKSIKEI